MSSEPHIEELYWVQQQLHGAIVFLVLSIVFVVFKLVATGIQQRDEKRVVAKTSAVMTVAALISFVPLCVLTILNASAYASFLKSQDRAEREHYVTLFYKTVYATSVLQPAACMLPKLSICFLYLRLFGINPKMTAVTKCLIGILIANAIAWSIPSVVICRPIARFWDGTLCQRCCLNYNTFGVWVSLPEIVFDLIILTLPLPVILKIQTSRLKKFGLISIFIAASSGIITSCLRLSVYIHKVYVVGPSVGSSTRLITMERSCTLAGPGTYLIAACVPSLPVIFIRLSPGLCSSLGALYQTLKSLCPNIKASKPAWTNSTAEQQPIDPQIDVRLTGAGALQTLAREGNAIGLTSTASVCSRCQSLQDMSEI